MKQGRTEKIGENRMATGRNSFSGSGIEACKGKEKKNERQNATTGRGDRRG